LKYSYPTRNYLLLLFSVLLFCLALFFERKVTWMANDYQALSKEAQSAFSHEEKQTASIMDSLASAVKYAPVISWEEINELSEKLKVPPGSLTFFIYKNEKLMYWSDNMVFLDQSSGEALHDQQMVFMRNGWYEYFSRRSGPYHIAGLLLIKHEYPFQNKYIDNRFNSRFHLPRNAGLQVDNVHASYPVVNSKGNFLFGIHYKDEEVSARYEIPLLIIFFSAIAILLLFLYSYGKYLIKVRPAMAFVMAGLLVLVRWIGLYYKVPSTFYNLDLFRPEYYASSYLLNSLGDFLISTLVFSYLVIFFHDYFGSVRIREDRGRYKLLLSYQVVFVFLFTFLFSVFVNYLLSGLILDSKISFNINNIFELSGYSLIGFAIIGLLLFSFYLICDGAIRFIQKTQFTAGQISILFLITQGLFLIILLWLRDSELFKDYGVTSFLLANSLIIFISYVRSSSKRLFSFTRSLLVILGFSVYAAKTIADFNDVKEKESRKLLAVKLENEHDLVAEYLFEEAASKISHDRFIASFLQAAGQHVFPFTFNQDILSKRIFQLYLNGYWGKFDIGIRFYDGAGNLIGANEPGSEGFAGYFKTVSQQGMPTYSKGFYYISNTAGRASYVGIVELQSPSDTVNAGTIVLQLNARFAQDEGGFPDLLLSDRIPDRKDFSNYSYAKYEYSQLITSYGKYPYFIQSEGYEKMYGVGRSERFIDFNGYSHLFYRHGLTGLIIVSRPNQSLVVLVTLFSYIFSFFCLLFVSMYIIYRLVKNSFRFDVNFKTRIQFTVFAFVMATILLTGGGTIYYIIGNYATNQNQKVSERLSSLLVLVENELERYPLSVGTLSEEVAYNFSRLSSDLGVDFNIYGTDGMLVYSTQPKIFDQDIIARTMNSFAYKELHVKQRTQFVQYEQMGSLNFLSAYEPLRNLHNRVTGYINLPYFAKQNVLKKEISSLLVTLINIYVFLFSFAMFVTFVISNRITRPLGIIQQRLSQIKLGKRTEPLEWGKKDEIGALVNEYNSMVDELHTSAERLARSERESAWREMAKQVAHEIKNPLTPMKLSVQHLQRAWREQSPNLDNIMQRFSQTLIEQIDTLSNIATEFSNFAKMPRASNAILDLDIILENIVNLYAESDKIKISYPSGKYRDLKVYADKDHLVRVFSNLFKNAIQAIPENREGLITVEIENTDHSYLVKIQDNGDGIPEDKIAKIFTPNFTTKTGGMGLGLAMVKSIIENAGGKIWFETKAGEGTIFFVMLPGYEEETA
jgi:two-component system nitrogen regulation sensor histidine kinase NtrY